MAKRDTIVALALCALFRSAGGGSSARRGGGPV